MPAKSCSARRFYARLADIPVPVDMVDIFRGSQYAPAIVQEALALKPRPQVIWMQLGVRNDEAAALAEANGMKVVMNRCPKIEYGRLSSEIAWMGVNTRTLTSKKAHHRRHSAHVAQPHQRTGRRDRPPPTAPQREAAGTIVRRATETARRNTRNASHSTRTGTFLTRITFRDLMACARSTVSLEPSYRGGEP